LQILFEEGCKFMVPCVTEPAESADSGSFEEEGPTEQQVDAAESMYIFQLLQKEKIELIVTSMEKSIVYAVPKAKAKAKAKSAPKGKAKGKVAKGAFAVEMPAENLMRNVQAEVKADLDDDDLAEACGLGEVDEEQETPSDGAGAASLMRSQFWVEDLYSAVHSVFTGLASEGVAPSVAAQRSVKRLLYHAALRFCWDAQLTLDGKELFAWSVVRKALKEKALESHQQAPMSREDEVTVLLLASLDRARSCAAANPAVENNFNQDLKKYAKDIHEFVTRNPLSAPPNFHTTCRAIVPSLWASAATMSNSKACRPRCPCLNATTLCDGLARRATQRHLHGFAIDFGILCSLPVVLKAS
jgi:hypothetical protein